MIYIIAKKRKKNNRLNRLNRYAIIPHMVQSEKAPKRRKGETPPFVTDLLETRQDTERDLAGKVSLVIGATRDIGAGIALDFAIHGSSIIGVHRDSGKEKRAQPVIQAIRSCEAPAEFPTRDINKPEDRTKITQTIKEKYNRQLDNLVLNASVGKTLTKESVMALVEELLPFMTPGGKVFLLQSTPAHFSKRVKTTDLMPKNYEDFANEKYELWEMLLAQKLKFDARQISLINICAPLVPETWNAGNFQKEDSSFVEKNNALSNTYGLPETATVKQIGEKVAELATRNDLPFGYVELFGNAYDARVALRDEYKDGDILVETIIYRGPAEEENANLWESRYLVRPKDCQGSDHLSDNQLGKAATQMLKAVGYYTNTPPAAQNYLEYPDPKEHIQPGDILTILAFTEKDQNDIRAETIIGKKPGLAK